MVTVRLIGGAGNQMFQYAFAKALARAKDTDFQLDLTYLLDRTPHPDFVYRGYQLDVFRTSPRFTLLSKFARCLPVPLFYVGLSYVITLVKHAVGVQKRVSDGRAGFNPEIFSVKGDVYLSGYWQGEKYFKSIESEIRKDFSFLSPLGSGTKKLADKIRGTNSVCIHVRRGDYVMSPSASKVIGFAGGSYYERALKLITRRVKQPHFFVFSDDIAWCRDNFQFSFPTEFIAPDYGGGKWHEHLELMILCKHFIIANSTFSWWAAWLNKNPQKIVIAPARWYADEHPAEIVPEGWVKL